MTPIAHSSLDQPCQLGDVPRWDFESDVIVVGFGAARRMRGDRGRAGRRARDAVRGTLAVTAARQRAVGRRDLPGGGGGTPIQREAGFEDSHRSLYKYLAMAGGPNTDPAKVHMSTRTAASRTMTGCRAGRRVQNSYIAERRIEPSTDDCLIWSGSEEAWPFVEQAQAAPRGHCPKFAGMGGGRYVMDVLARRVQRPASACSSMRAHSR